MYGLFIALLSAYLVMVLVIVIYQRKLMYHPNVEINAPQYYGLSKMEDVNILSRDGTQIQIWSHKPKEGFPTVVYFHGNAGNLSDRSAKFGAMVEAGFGVVALSYRSFGKSAGEISEQGLYEDARAAIDYAINAKGMSSANLIYFGESLGSGVAVQMATERAPGLLMLEAAYTSVETRSAELFYYILGVRYLVRDKYDSLSKIGKVRAPLVMIHGTLDPTIPIRHGRKLFEAANEPKTLVVYPEVHHTDFTNEQIVSPLLNAARKYRLINEIPPI